MIIVSVSGGVQVEMESAQNIKSSNLPGHEFIFDYSVKVTNKNPFPIRLLSRRWIIIDDYGRSPIRRKASSIFGMQTSLRPDQFYRYTDSVNLRAEVGNIRGFLMAEHMISHEPIKIQMPVLQLATNYKMN